MHGGASPGAPQGQGNGMFKHGLRSVEEIERRRTMTAEMRRIRREIRELGAPVEGTARRRRGAADRRA
jgi:hypothetical protein